MNKFVQIIKISICFIISAGLLLSCQNTSSKGRSSSLSDNLKTAGGLSRNEIDVIFQKATEHLLNAWDSVEQTKRLPRSIEKGFRPIRDWTSGFYPANLWISYEYGKDPDLLEKAEMASAIIEDEKYNTQDHDIGFRIYCPYGRGYDLTNDPEYKEVIIQAAKSAIQRYSPAVRAIKSWGSRPERDWQYPVIIDNMMNLELLFAATRLTGDSVYYNVAINHALTTMKNQYREDYSCSHVVDYDSLTGAFRKRDWNNGNNDPATSAWSRGQSWGLYGFTMVYRETRDERFLDQAEKIADFLLSHPNMPEDMVPYWDYHAPEVPTFRDASAAAIMASALMELSGYPEKNGKRYFEAGEKILKSLSSPEYLAEPGTNGDFLLKHATGNNLKKSERDGTLIYADYYFLEALLRYMEIKELNRVSLKAG
ncbi:MAG: glycoside hydrolase family 88 protein [Cytophagales bacterium]|nr:glycoside hydrolase family 88 protein [Cytophagales bacterium]